MENKSEENVDSNLKPLILSIGPYSESMNLVVARLHYAIVLGKSLLYQHRTKIDCHNSEVYFWNRRKALLIHATDQEGIKQISVNAITNDLKSGSQLFADLLGWT